MFNLRTANTLILIRLPKHDATAKISFPLRKEAKTTVDGSPKIDKQTKIRGLGVYSVFIVYST